MIIVGAFALILVLVAVLMVWLSKGSGQDGSAGGSIVKELHDQLEINRALRQENTQLKKQIEKLSHGK